MSDINAFYTYGSSAWLLTQGIVLAIFPQEVLHFMSTSSITETVAAANEGALSITPNQLYFLRAIGGILTAFAIATFFVKPRNPPSQLPSPNEPRTPLTTTASTGLPAAGAVVLPLTMVVHVVMGGYYYTRFINEDSWKWQALMIVSAVMASTGVFSLLFAGETPRPDDKKPIQQRAEEKKRL